MVILPCPPEPTLLPQDPGAIPCTPAPVIVVRTPRSTSRSDERGPDWAGVSATLMIVLLPFVVAVLWLAWRRRSGLIDTPTTACSALTPGLREAVGATAPLDRPFRSPFSARPCLWFSWKVERYQRNARGGGYWQTLEEGSPAAPFWVVDATGRALVRPREAKFEGAITTTRVGRDFDPPFSRWQLRRWSLIGEDAVERSISVADEKLMADPSDRRWWKDGTAGPIGETKGRVRVRESVIGPGVELHVRGPVAARAEGGVQFQDGQEPLRLATESEADIVASNTAVLRWLGPPTLIASIVVGPLLSYGLRDRFDPLWALGVLVPEALLVALAWALRVRERRRASIFFDGLGIPPAQGSGPPPVPVEAGSTWGDASGDDQAPVPDGTWLSPWEPSVLAVASALGPHGPHGPISGS